MIKVENISVMNFDNAIRGMRNPLESWDQSDSYWGKPHPDSLLGNYKFIIGENDLALALKLIKAGSDHSKFMRQIFVSMDITAPLYWWKEFDTYKVGTVANSTSTMHKLGTRVLTIEDFSFDTIDTYVLGVLEHINYLASEWRKVRNTDPETAKKIWRMLIQHLPDSFLQKRTWTGNYAVASNMHNAREFHKLSEWRDFCRVIEGLPYSEFITVERSK